MLDEVDGETWVSRRDDRIRRPAHRIGAKSADGIPYLVPEIQLFYKAARRRPKDQQDFDAAIGILNGDQRRWLAGAVAATYGDHPWQARLTAPVTGP